MGEEGVVLVAMPWQLLQFPSIQLGILKAVLERAGMRAQVRSFHLAFMEHCRQATAAGPLDGRIGIRDYETVAADYHTVGMGDWIFAVPPFRPALDPDGDYLEYLRHEEVPEAAITKALAMRALVPGFLERCAQDVLAVGPRVIGFTTTFNQAVSSLVLARFLKDRDPSVAIIFGGAACEGPMGAALHRVFPWVDVVVRGEAESILPNLVKDLLADGPVRPQPGLCYREESRSVVIPRSGCPTVPLDEIPTPAYDEYFVRLAKTDFAADLSDDVRLPYETSRGCWWGEKSHCAFCGLDEANIVFRSKSPDRVLHEIAKLATRYKRLAFQMADFILDVRYLRDVLPRLRDAGYDLSIFYETKANLKREHVAMMRAAGVDRIQPGLESLSTPILKLIGKGVTAFQNIRLLKWCARYGVRPFWNLVYGFPGEPVEEYARMADVVPSLTHLQPPRLCRLAMHRFSPYYERPQGWAIQIAGPLPYYRHIYPVDDATLADLAYDFEYRYTDGREPRAYAAPFCRAVERWQQCGQAGYRSLRYRRGPGFIVVRDRRPGIEPADYTFEDLEAKIYLACEDGATATEALAALGPAGSADLTVDDVRKFLNELVDLRLAYAEGGRYLALALPAHLPEQTQQDARAFNRPQRRTPWPRNRGNPGARGRKAHGS